MLLSTSVNFFDKQSGFSVAPAAIYCIVAHVLTYCQQRVFFPHQTTYRLHVGCDYYKYKSTNLMMDANSMFRMFTAGVGVCAFVTTVTTLTFF